MPSQQALVDFLKGVKEQAPETAIAVFGDLAVPYGDVVEILNLGAANDLKMVLATTKKDNAATAAVNGDALSGQAAASASASKSASTTETR